MDKHVIIVAGGSGRRMGTALPKQFLFLQGKPVLWHTLAAFYKAYNDLKFILVLPRNYLEEGKALAGSSLNPDSIIIVTGGATRYESVKNGLQKVPPGCIVAVHDGVRCLVTPCLIRMCYEETAISGNAIPCISPVDSLRILNATGNQVLDRNSVRLIQTPQTFYSTVLKRAFMQEYDESFTDEAIVVENTGEKIHLVEGEATNIKITSPLDLLLAQQILAQRENRAQYPE